MAGTTKPPDKTVVGPVSEYLNAFGAIHLIVTVAGFALPGVFEYLIALNIADDVAHLVLAVAPIGLD